MYNEAKSDKQAEVHVHDGIIIYYEHLRNQLPEICLQGKDFYTNEFLKASPLAKHLYEKNLRIIREKAREKEKPANTHKCQSDECSD